MAAQPPSHALECPRCSSRFADDALHTPKLLPSCKHTICRGCVKQILSTTPPECPVCHARAADVADAESVRTHEALLVDGASQACDICRIAGTAGTTAVIQCEDCPQGRQRLCGEIHAGAHGEHFFDHEHVFRLAPSQKQCSEAKHGQKPLEYSCDCGGVLCASCAILTHKPHTQELLEDGAAACRQKLGDTIKSVEDVLAQIRGASQAMDDKEAVLIGEIRGHVGVLHREVDAFGTRMEGLVLEAIAARRQALASQTALVEGRVVSAERIVREARWALDHGSDVGLLRMQGEVEAAMGRAMEVVREAGSAVRATADDVRVVVNSDGMGSFISGVEGTMRVDVRVDWGCVSFGGVVASGFSNPRGVVVDRGGNIVVTSEHCVSIVDGSGGVVGWMGSLGNGRGQLDGPVGVVVRGNGEIVVADCLNNRVVVFSGAGDVVRMFGSKGGSNEQFNCPCYLAMSREEELYVADYSSHRVQVMSVEGRYIRTIGQGQLMHPTGIAIDEGRGVVYVGDHGNERVSVFSKAGAFVRTFGEGKLQKVYGVAYDERADVVAVATGVSSVEVFRGSDGSHVRSLQHADIESPYGVGFDNEGRLLVTGYDSGNIGRWG